MTVNSAGRGTAGVRQPARQHGYRWTGAAVREVRERLEAGYRTLTAQLVIAESEAGVHSDEAALALLGTLRQTLEEIEAALDRLDAGSYGTCEDCGRPIPEDRLEILPHARCCVSCQRRRQRTER